MKALLISTGLALILTVTPGAAQTAEPGLPGVTAEQEFHAQVEEGQWLVTDMMGHEVLGPNEESIGTISDFIFGEDGSIVAAVIGVGEYLGIGVKDVAVSYEHLNVEREADDLRISTDLERDQIEDAPEFDRLAGLDATPGEPSMPATPGEPSMPATPGEPATPGATPGAPGQQDLPSQSR